MGLRETLEAATPWPWPADLKGILRFDQRGGGYVDTADARLIALAPELAALVLDMGETLNECAGYTDWLDEQIDALLARLAQLGKEQT